MGRLSVLIAIEEGGISGQQRQLLSEIFDKCVSMRVYPGHGATQAAYQPPPPVTQMGDLMFNAEGEIYLGPGNSVEATIMQPGINPFRPYRPVRPRRQEVIVIDDSD